jgi:hypothetical protein
MMGGRRSSDGGVVSWVSCPAARWRVEVDVTSPEDEIRAR